MTLDEQVARKIGTKVKPYSTQIAAAWEIVDYCKKLGPIDLDGDNEGFRFFIFNDSGPDLFGQAETAPMAIARAFLKLP